MDINDIKDRIVILNGANGVGKDEFATEVVKVIHKFIPELAWQKVDSVGFIKKVATESGVWDGKKDEKGRRLLYDLKQAFDRYSDASTVFALRDIMKFINDNLVPTIQFVHIREPENIKKIVNLLNQRYRNKALITTVLVRAKNIGESYSVASNPSDQNVEKYTYDFIVDNVFGNPLESEAELFVNTIF